MYFRHARLRDVDPESQQFAVNARCARQRVACAIVRINERTFAGTIGKFNVANK